MSTDNEGSAVPSGPDRPTAPEAPAHPPAPGTGMPGTGNPGAGTPGTGGPDYPLPAPGTGDPGRTAEQPTVAGGRPGDVPPPPGAPPAPGMASAGGPPPGSEAWPPPQPPAGGSGWGAHMPPPPGGGGPGKKRSGLVAAVLVAALVAGGVGGGVGFWAAEHESGGGSTTLSAPGESEQVNRSPKSVAGIAQKALPSVVTLEARGSSGEEGGTGTGFVYDKEGHILTNNHVVASAANGGELTATFSNGKEYGAEVVGRAEGYDVAVIKLKNADDAKLEPLPLGDSEKNVAVGDATIAIGAPFGLAGTVTTGIISAKNRPVASGDGSSSNASYMSALQTDASINPGNSGGPLLNADGAVIGINSAIQPAGGGGGLGGEQAGSVGLGFAIPINQAKRVADNLIETGQPVYAVIGVQVEMGQQDGGGARISENGQGGSPAVTEGGPADKAGLQPGDVITKLDDTLIDSGPTLISEIWTHQPGEKVEITYERDGKESTVELTLGERKGDDS